MILLRLLVARRGESQDVAAKDRPRASGPLSATRGWSYAALTAISTRLPADTGDLAAWSSTSCNPLDTGHDRPQSRPPTLHLVVPPRPRWTAAAGHLIPVPGTTVAAAITEWSAPRRPAATNRQDDAELPDRAGMTAALLRRVTLRRPTAPVASLVEPASSVCRCRCWSRDLCLWRRPWRVS